MLIPAFAKLSYHLTPVILISRLRYPPHRRFPPVVHRRYYVIGSSIIRPWQFHHDTAARRPTPPHLTTK